MIHPNTEIRYIDDRIGYGVVAKQLIPKGTITWVQDEFDRSFTPGQYRALEATYRAVLHTYAFRDSKGNHILCWDNAKYVNHSFKSNCLSTAYNFELAIRDIYPGDQLTDDYGYLNLEKPFRGIDEGTKRKTVYPDDLLKYHKIWDKKLLSAFKNLPEVEQPLRLFFSHEEWKRMHKIAYGQIEMDSILNCYFDIASTDEVP